MSRKNLYHTCIFHFGYAPIFKIFMSIQPLPLEKNSDFPSLGWEIYVQYII